MICKNCGALNEDTNQFCIKCGTPLIVANTDSSEQLSSSNQPTPQPEQGLQNKDLLKDKLTPAEGEVSVRTYYCTYYLSRLLGLESWGYLGVTNMRVIFQALGTSNAGNSVIQSEIPIADVSGISSYKGTFFSFRHLLTAFIATGILASMFSTITILLAGAGGFLATLMLSGAVSSSIPILQIVGWAVGIGGFLFSLSIARESIWRSILAGIATSSFATAGSGGLLRGLLSDVSAILNSSSTTGSGGLAAIAFFFGFLVGLYTLFCFIWYARRPTFSLAISSKGGSDTPIDISGASGLGLFSVSAGRALTAEPAKDAELMLQELGAVILDIQILGDMGIDKWKVF